MSKAHKDQGFLLDKDAASAAHNLYLVHTTLKDSGFLNDSSEVFSVYG